MNYNRRKDFYIHCGLFCPHLGSFCVVSSLTKFRPNFTSGLLQVILPRPRIGMLSLVTRDEIWPERSERRNTKTTKMRTKKSAINKKINSQIKKPHLKMIPIKRQKIFILHLLQSINNKIFIVFHLFFLFVREERL